MYGKHFLHNFPCITTLIFPFVLCDFFSPFVIVMCLSEITSRCFVCFSCDLDFLMTVCRELQIFRHTQHSAGSDVKNVTCIDL